MFTNEHLESIASTIFSYEESEKSRNHYGRYRDSLPYVGSAVLATGRADGDLTWAMNLKLGANPAQLTASNYAYQHPVYFIAAFEDVPEVRDAIRERFEAQLSGESPLDDSRSTLYARKLPPPKDPGQRFKRATEGYFHPFHAAWYTPKAIAKLANERYTYRSDQLSWLLRVRDALEQQGQDPSILQQAATETVLRILRDTKTADHISIAKLLPLTDQTEMEPVLAKAPKSFATLLVTLDNPSSEGMVRGLRALAGSSRAGLLSFMRRAPTIEELLKSNVKGAGAVWRRMPWVYLGPIVQEHGTALRAALLKRTELSYDQLKECLSDHSERFSLMGNAPEAPGADDENVYGSFSNDTEPRHVLTDDLGPWPDFVHGMRRYELAKALRKELIRAYSPQVARLVAFRHLTQREDLVNYTNPVLTEAVTRALEAYPTPVGRSRSRELNGEPAFYVEVV